MQADARTFHTRDYPLLVPYRWRRAEFIVAEFIILRVAYILFLYNYRKDYKDYGNRQIDKKDVYRNLFGVCHKLLTFR